MTGSGSTGGTGPTVLFADDFNRADGPIGNGWTTAPAGDVVVSGNQAAALSWDAIAVRDIGISTGYRVSAKFSGKEWPGLLLRRDGSGADYWLVRSAAIELVRRQGGSTLLAGGPTDPGGTLTLWAEVRELAAGAGTEIKWGHGTTTVATTVDTQAGRPAGTMVGLLLQNGRATADDFTVETLDAAPAAHTGTGTLAADATATGAGTPSAVNAGTLDAGGDTAGSGTPALPGTATLDGTGSTSGTGAAAESGAGTADSEGTITATGAAVVAGTGTLASDAGILGAGSASSAGAGSGTLTADGVFTATGVVGELTGTAGLDATGTLTGAATAHTEGTAELTAVGGIDGAGIARQAGSGTAALDGDGALTGSGTRSVEPPAHPGFGLRLACYDIDGPLRGRARGMLVERYARAGEPGRLKVAFSKLAPRGELFKAPVEIAVEYLAADGVTWVEPEDGRYVIAHDDHERTADPTGSHDLNLLGIVQRLNAAKVLTGPDADIQTDGKRQFLSKRPGEIIGTLLTEAKARGAFPTLTAGFTDSHDSHGNPWQLVYNRAYEMNHSLLGILQNLYDGGAVDYWIEGRTLHMVPAGVRGRELADGMDPVYLRDRYARVSPERDDWTKLANHVVLIGDEGAIWEKTNHEAYAPFGRVETVILAGGVSNEATAMMMMDRALAEGADVGRQITREWQWAPGIRWMPDRDIRVGDWVLADTSAGTRQRVRVADVMIRQGPDGIEAFVTLGTVHDDLQTRMAKRQIGIEGGAGVGSIGRPTPKPPPDPTNQFGQRPEQFTVTVSAWPIPAGYGGVFGASCRPPRRTDRGVVTAVDWHDPRRQAGTAEAVAGDR